MEEIKYELLNKLWIDWADRYVDWHRKIILSLKELRSYVEKRLNAPSEPVALDTSRHYVDIVDINDENIKPEIRFNNITSNEEVIVGISFMFEHSSQNKPKKIFYFPVAARFYDNKPQFCFWNSSNKTIDDTFLWSSDIEYFANEIICRIINQFKYSPFVGIKDKPKIGFIES